MGVFKFLLESYLQNTLIKTHYVSFPTQTIRPLATHFVLTLSLFFSLNPRFFYSISLVLIGLSLFNPHLPSTSSGDQVKLSVFGLGH